MQENVTYLHLTAGASLPQLKSERNYKAVVMIEDEVTKEWQWEVSQWLVKTGCLYMMAWGRDCSSWDDSVDYANIEDCNYEGIPDEKFIMTTWHDDEPLAEVLGFAKESARHGHVDLDSTLIIHIGPHEKEKNTLRAFHEAWA